jgi:predicted metallo-beta-lactamase superfamily hydrolase
VALQNLNDEDVDISKACESIRENREASDTETIGYYNLKQHKPWFDDECSELYQRK